MKYAIRVAGKDVWVHDEHDGPLTLVRVLKIAGQARDEVIIYKDGLPHMRFRPRVGASLIASERASH